MLKEQTPSDRSVSERTNAQPNVNVRRSREVNLRVNETLLEKRQ